MEAEYFIQEYQELLKEKLTEVHQNQLKQSKEKGEEDGKRNLPSVDDNFTTPVEFEIRNKYQAEIETLFQNGKQVLNDLEEKGFKAVSQELNDLKEENIQQKIQEESLNRDRKLEELNARLATMDDSDQDKVVDTEVHNNKRRRL